MLVPQALMGVATVALTYDLVRRPFGRAAGFVAGLALALTPITVAISRHNNPDALLVLCSVAALWFVVRALEDGRTRWLVLSGVVRRPRLRGQDGRRADRRARRSPPPTCGSRRAAALAAVRQLCRRRRGDGRGRARLAGARWLTPAADRPWVSGTSDNSIWSLIFGYNGLGRLFGQDGGPGGGAGAAGGGGGGVFGGDTGPLRLLNEALGGQAGWLLGFALVGGVALLVATPAAPQRRAHRLADRHRRRVRSSTAVAFSHAEGIFHPYYVSLLAPFTAALVGGASALCCRAASPRASLAPLRRWPASRRARRPARQPGSLDLVPALLVAVGVVAAVALAAARARSAAGGVAVGRRGRRAAARAPARLVARRRSATPTSGTFPARRPGPRRMGGGPGGGGGGDARRRRLAGSAPELTAAVAYARPTAAARSPSSSQSGAAGAAHHRRRGRRRDRRLLRPREPGQRRVARRRRRGGRIRWVLPRQRRRDEGTTAGRRRARSWPSSRRSASPSRPSTASTTCRARPRAEDALRSACGIVRRRLGGLAGR